ncbi:MAG: hypothetical protein AAFN59_12155, partial [Pseudomonadota bacterium]
HGLDRLPDLEPAQDKLRKARHAMFAFDEIELTANSAMDEATTPALRAERSSTVARLTCYTMNAILFLMAFPVGAALLTFNLLGGENIRITAHAIALTGMSIALSLTEVGANIF